LNFNQTKKALTYKKHNYHIMKTHYFKTFCKIVIALLVVLLYQQAIGASATAHLSKKSVGPGDTLQVQKPGKLKRVKKIKKDEDDLEDGVDNDIRARSRQEFLQQRDPRLNRIPLERLLIAREKRDQFLNNVKVRIQNNRPQGTTIKPSGSAATSPTAPPTISGMQWNERGPNNVGGRTRALMFDMGDAANGYKRVIAGGVGGGLWVTSDITATPVQWTKINDFFDNIAISCIAQNPVNPLEIYAGTGEGFLNGDAIQGLGVWKSSDGGATWTHLASTTGFKYINAILVDRNGSVYVAGESDIFVGFGVDQSTDGGSTWTNVINASEAGADLQLAANGDVYASTGVIYLTGHIYISDFTVNGVHTGNVGTWTNITPASNGTITPATTAWNRIKLATAPSDANIVYAFFEPDYNSTGNLKLSSVQQYNKSANTWTVKAVPTEAFSNGQSWYSIAAAIDPNNPSVLYAGSLDAEKSIDGGSTWTRYSVWSASTSASNYVHADHHAYVYAPGSSTRLLMGTDGGVFYTVNANVTPSFVNKNNGYDVTQFYSVALHPTSTNYALAGAQDNGSEKFSSAGIGPTTVATGGDGADVFIDQTNGNIQVTSYVYDNYYVSTDNGNTFNRLSGYGNGQFINPTAYDPSTKNLYAGSASGYYYRAANILSPAYNEVAVPAFSGANVTTVAVAPITANRVYFGLDNGSVVRVDSAQTGTSRTGVVVAPNVGSNVTVSCVAVDPATEDHILVTYSNYGVTHVIETHNASAATPTWTNVSGNLPDMPVRWALFYPGDPTKAVIATELGVWTTDLINGASTTWDPTNTGLANVEVDMLTYRVSDKTLAAATHGRGLFTATLPSALSNDASLANLQLSTGTLTPAFASATTSYTASVANTVTSLTETPTTTNAAATVKVNGTTVTSGSASGTIALNVGPNTITTIVTAQDGATTKTYTVTVTRAPSTNDNLSAIALVNPTTAKTTVSGPDAGDYTASVSNATASIEVMPATAVNTSTVKVNGVTVASGAASSPIALNVGPNTVTTVVTAQDGVSTKTYVITVTRAPSPDATLSNLTLSTGTLSPAFASATTSYTASVANTVTSLTLTPATTNAAATVKVNGTAVTSGSASGAIALNVGPNTVTTVVTAQDGATTKTYTVTVTRAPSTNDNLSALALVNPTTAKTTVSGPDAGDYTASVSNATASIEVMPTTAVNTSTVKVDGVTVTSGAASSPIALNVGPNTITTVVTAQDGVSAKTYVITVTRISADATLSNLTLSTGTLTPAFASGTTSYTASVANTVASITATPTTTSAVATVKVNGTAVTSGMASGAIALNVGPNTITTVVTAQDGTTKQTYTVTVTRAPSTNDNLSAIALVNPTTAKTTVSGPDAGDYTASVSNATASIEVMPTTAVNTSTVKVNGVTVASGSASNPITLNVGPNTLTTVVTAQDGISTKTYVITVTRAPSADATLTALTLSTGTLSPAFASGTTGYTASVANTVTSITATPTTTNAGATVTVSGTAVTSGTASGAISLNVGPNTVTTVVTAQNGTTTKTYTVTVTRAPSSNDNLSALKLVNPTTAKTTVAGPDAGDYTASVGNATTSIEVIPTTSVTTSTVTVNGTAVISGSASNPISLNTGANIITTVVTAQDGVSTHTYVITVSRASTGINIAYETVSVSSPTDHPQMMGEEIMVHQALSPNGDGVNDYLVINGIARYPDNKLQIMNRNGQMIFEAIGYDNSTRVFDGHSNKNGVMQLPGTYFYSLDYNINGVVKHKTGFIVLKY